MPSIRSFAFVLLLAACTNAANWAVIIAGSKTYGNYRHQADACHAYQVVKNNGIPEENIILMMYDDIANAAENPFPGQIFNKPTEKGVKGFDVYEGCRPAYTGKQVTAETFMAVLTGDANSAGGKVLKSTSEDKVFVNFVDHGGVGSIMMPDGKLFYSKQLIETLHTMHSNKMYSRLVFYMEACESGSMFQNLSTSLNIYATTAANGKESSWGTYCPPMDKVNGKEMHSCLGDLYSVNWMEDSDRAAAQASETLEQQYLKVKTLTNKSHSEEFGDKSFSDEKIHDFQGAADALVKPIALPRTVEEDAQEQSMREASAVPSRDIPLVTKFYKYMRAPAGQRQQLAQALISEIEHRESTDEVFNKIAAAVTGDSSGALLTADMPLTAHNCQEEATNGVMAACGSFTDYSLKYTRVIVNLCESGHSAATIVATARATCAARK